VWKRRAESSIGDNRPQAKKAGQKPLDDANREAFPFPAGNDEKLLHRRFQGFARCEFDNFLPWILISFPVWVRPRVLSLTHAKGSKATRVKA